MKKKMRLVVIGGSSGMGLEIAKTMQKLGYEVIIAGRTKEKLEKARNEIGEVKTYVVDSRVEKELAQFFSKIGSIDHLVISAADFFTGPFIEGKSEDARNYFDSKFWGQYYAAKYAAPKMGQNSSITFFSGASNHKPMANFAAGTAINAAIEGLIRALAIELSPIRVNAISPGFIVTPIWDTIPEKKRLKTFKEIAQKLPAKRMGQPEDIAQAARFLIECTYATGSVVHVDGGYSLV